MADGARKNMVSRIVLSPWTILISAALGVLIGMETPTVSMVLKPLGDIYLSLLKMTVVPILMSAIALNMGRLTASGASGQYLARLLGLFALTFVASGVLGIVLAMIGHPGVVGADHLRALGSMVQDSGYAPDLEMSLSAPAAEATDQGVLSFIAQLIPTNVFQAMADGSTLKVLIFSILFGVALGVLPGASSASLFDALESAYKALEKLVAWLMYVLPVGLCCMVAAQVSSTGADMIIMMTGFVGVVAACYGVLLVVGLGIMAWRFSLSPWRLIRDLREPLILSVATGNSLACVPSSINALEGSLRLSERDVGLLIPLGIGICRYANVIYFAVATIFVAQLYNVDLSFGQLIFVVVGCILAGVATAGASGVVTLAMLGIVLTPLKMPLDGVLPLFIAVEPIMTPLRTFANVFLNLVVSSMMSRSVDDVPALFDLEPSVALAEHRD